MVEKKEMLTPEQMYNEIIKFPYTSVEYNEGIGSIKYSLMLESKYDEYVLCFHSGLTGSRKGKKYSDIFDIVGCERTKGGKLHVKESFPEYFGDELLLLQRNEVEYNIAYKQLCVGVIIKSGDQYVVLQNTEKHRLANKITMIQGHVDYSPEIYRMSIIDYLKRTATKELLEEVSGFGEFEDRLDKLLIDRLIINDKFGSCTSIEHCGVVMTLHLPATFDLNKLTSKEPEKHEVKVYDSIDLINNENVDDWLKLAINNLG